jgi:hypothetical protein
MKNFLLILVIILLAFNFSVAQRAKIVVEHVTPHDVTTLEFPTNSVSTGLSVVPKETFVYLSAWNWQNTQQITNATFTILSKPAGSNSEIIVHNPTMVYFKPDLKGEYQIHLSMTTTGGSHDTTTKIYAANFVGVGNFDGVPAQYPNCMSCHGSTPKFIAIFNKWKESGHATIFKRQITSGSAYYSTSCMKCHTTGYDHNLVAANNGFDDVASQLGWVWQAPPNPGKWDSLKTGFPALVNHATIGCEACHGPGGEHAFGGVPSKIQITTENGICAQCHDEPWRHNKYSEYENSLHSHALWSASFSQGAASQNNNLQNCIRCHDAKGYINFTNGLTTNTTGMPAADHVVISCATCHDPHGNNNVASLRPTPAGSDTLGNGFSYTSFGGLGQTCMNCHKARRNGNTYTATPPNNAHWGPHHSVQTDMLFAENAVDFGTPFISGNHKFAVGNTCVTCHMTATVDTGNVNRDKVGGHSMKLYNPETGYYHLTSCVPCHGQKNSIHDFMAAFDHDGDGTIESIPAELEGLEKILVKSLPPAGQDTIIWSQVTEPNQIKAYWNYMMIAYDGSKGMHNPRYAMDVLTKSILAIGGIIPVQLTSFNADIEGNNVTLSWMTATETNNAGFDVEKKSASSWNKIGFVQGKGTTTQLQNYFFSDNLSDLQNGDKVYYRLKQIDHDGSYSYSKEIEVVYEGGPGSYSISQNYPNPFNPSTSISYILPTESNVKISVYNVTGEVVKVLVNSTLQSGTHEASFNTKDVNASSGIYFYTIEANATDGSVSFKQTKKMVLLK